MKTNNKLTKVTKQPYLYTKVFKKTLRQTKSPKITSHHPKTIKIYIPNKTLTQIMMMKSFQVSKYKIRNNKQITKVLRVTIILIRILKSISMFKNKIKVQSIKRITISNRQHIIECHQQTTLPKPAQIKMFLLTVMMINRIDRSRIMGSSVNNRKMTFTRMV